MKIAYGGRTWQWEQECTLRQGLAIQEFTGLPLVEWERSLAQPDEMAHLTSLAAAYWLMLAQNGEDVPLDEIDFNLGEFTRGLAAAIDAESPAAAGGEEPGPTQTSRAGPPASPSPPDLLTPQTSPNGTEVPAPLTGS